MLGFGELGLELGFFFGCGVREKLVTETVGTFWWGHIGGGILFASPFPIFATRYGWDDVSHGRFFYSPDPPTLKPIHHAFRGDPREDDRVRGWNGCGQKK